MARMTRKERWPSLWLIVGEDGQGGRTKPLALDLPGDEEGALAVFSFEEEAQMYLQVAAPEGSWRVEEVEVGELVSMLDRGICSTAKRLALDPTPPQVSAREANLLVCTSRQGFLGRLRGNAEDAAMDGSRGSH